MNRIAFSLLALLLAAAAPLHAIEIGEPMEDVGTILPLDGGQSLQLTIKDKKVVAYFADDKNLVIESPAESIVFVVDDPGHKSDKYRTLLVQGPDAGLAGPRILHPPYLLETKLIIRFKDGSTRNIPYLKVQLNRNVQEASE